MGMLLYMLWYIDYSQLSSHLPPSGQTKSTVKRKLYEDGALPVSEGSKKVIKKATATVSMVVQGSSCSQSSLKKQKTGGESGKWIPSLQHKGILLWGLQSSLCQTWWRTWSYHWKSNYWKPFNITDRIYHKYEFHVAAYFDLFVKDAQSSTATAGPNGNYEGEKIESKMLFKKMDYIITIVWNYTHYLSHVVILHPTVLDCTLGSTLHSANVWQWVSNWGPGLVHTNLTSLPFQN